MKTIPVGTRGHFAVVDDADFDLVSKYRWYLAISRKINHEVCYAVSSINGNKSFRMHRLICSPPKGKVIDHKDFNGLNNTRANLRVCTMAENSRSRRKAANKSSKYRGVFWYKRTRQWKSFIYTKDKGIYLGAFHNEEDAAAAYNLAAKKYFGEFATMNLVGDRADASNRIKRDIRVSAIF